jgi:hypothetical protein
MAILVFGLILFGVSTVRQTHASTDTYVSWRDAYDRILIRNKQEQLSPYLALP